MRDIMAEMHNHAIKQKGEHENPKCNLCHLQDVKNKNIDCSPPCPVCCEAGQAGYELAHEM